MLRLPDTYEPKIAKIGNFWTFWHVIQPICHLFKIQKRAFFLTLLRWKKCSDILKRASVGGGESEHMKACHFSHFQFQLLVLQLSTSGGRGEIENVKNDSLQMFTFTSANRCYFWNVTALFPSMKHWVKWPFVGFWQDGLLAKLQT